MTRADINLCLLEEDIFAFDALAHTTYLAQTNETLDSMSFKRQKKLTL